MIELHPYQKEGAAWLSGRKTALLADEMGLGKSAQAIRAAAAIGAKRMLVVCPASLRENWLSELRKFWPSSTTLEWIKPQSSTRLTSMQSIVCSYEWAAQNYLECPGRFDVCVLDEAHYLKSVDARRTVGVFGKDGLVRKSDRVWALTGTPAPNHAGELWPILYTFGATPLSYPLFLKRYCTLKEGTLSATGTKREAIPELHGLLAKIMLRRRKADVLKDLPPITFGSVTVEPGEFNPELHSSFGHYIFPADRREELKQKLSLQEQMVMEVLAGKKTPQEKVRALEALSSSVSTLRRYLGIQKIQPAAELIKQELNSFAYDKVVVFAIHRDVIEGLRVALDRFGPVTYYGGMKDETKEKNMHRFNTMDKYKVFIGNIVAAGTGINLTRAHQVIFVEQDWVPANNLQAAMRCHRIGQTNPVSVRVLGIANSLDEKVSGILRKKSAELHEMFDSDRAKRALQNSKTGRKEGITTSDDESGVRG